MMDSWVSGEINKGDLILAILNNHTDIGFYLGKGRGGSHQYHSIERLNWWLSRIREGKIKSDRIPAVAYITNCTKYRMVKYSPDLIINKELKEKYNNSLEALKLLNI